jgi:bifunctional ADP-heptose synthase (sugar kinase/adenylyltransferase)
VAARAAGATVREAMVLAMAAASIVIHQLGTTGTATILQLTDLLAARGIKSAICPARPAIP